jgi:rare lipoprotein A
MGDSLFNQLFFRLKGAIGALLAAILIQACASAPPPAPEGRPQPIPKPYRVGKTWYQPLAHARDFRQTGIASWYGKDFHGKNTSNGEIYNMHAMTAAHKTLPLGTFVRVKNLTNGKSIDVRINDRGPFVRDRIIDLSFAGASRLDIVGPGTAPVEIEALGTPVPPVAKGTVGGYIPGDYYSGQFTFQVGAFANRQNAERLKDKLSHRYANAHIDTTHTGEEIFYRVRVGKCTSLEEAQKFEQGLNQNGYPEAFIVAE